MAECEHRSVDDQYVKPLMESRARTKVILEGVSHILLNQSTGKRVSIPISGVHVARLGEESNMVALGRDHDDELRLWFWSITFSALAIELADTHNPVMNLLLKSDLHIMNLLLQDVLKLALGYTVTEVVDVVRKASLTGTYNPVAHQR